MALVFTRRIRRFNNITLYRSIKTTSTRIQIMEDLQQNPFYEKYSKKIATLQKTAPEEFVERIEKKTAVQEKSTKDDTGERRYASVLKPKEPLKCDAPPTRKRLSDIFKVELVKDNDAAEIKTIWLQYHIQKDVIAATIPTDVYTKMIERVNKYPTFLFPLPRSQGYEFIMCQASGDDVHFTTLLCYQVHKENAPECLTMYHYKELAEEKGIILMRGEFDKDVINAQEAQCLANQFQIYYGQNNAAKLNLLDNFTNKPSNFKHMDLISELENLSIS